MKLIIFRLVLRVLIGLQVNRLTVDFRGLDGTVTPVDDLSFSLARGETLGFVGESG